MTVIDRPTAQSAANVISAETVANANTAARVGGAMRDMSDSVLFAIDTSAKLTSFIGLGATPSTTGTIRWAQGSSLRGRNNANTTDIAFMDWGVTATDQITFGDDSNSNGLAFRAAAGGHNFYVSTVNSLSVGSAVVSVGVNQFQFPATISSPVLFHVNGNAPTNMSVRAEGATGTNVSGGRLLLQGGIKNGTGVRRGPVLQLNVDDTEANMVDMLEVCEVIAGNRVMAMCRPTHLTATQMPANTGDMVMYIASAVTVPTASAVGGGILYVEAGALKYRGTSGTITVLGPA